MTLQTRPCRWDSLNSQDLLQASPHPLPSSGLTLLPSLELGAGGGLVGLAIARGCQIRKPVVITDQLPMLPLMQQNIALNSLQTKVIAEVLDWGTPLLPSIKHHLSPPASPEAEEQHPDIILAADCVYFEPAFPLLLQSLRQLVGPETVCHFCFKKRRKADWRFIRNMKKQFDVTDVQYDEQPRDRRDGIYLYQVRRKSSGKNAR
jgi:protein N-lysine methyltransferase METTL21A